MAQLGTAEPPEFTAFVQSITSGNADDEGAMPRDVQDQILGAMRKRLAAPPVADLEAVLHRAVPADKARQLLFWPSDEDMRLYPALLVGPPPGAPPTHPAAKLQSLTLTLLYLAHGRTWARVKPFIEAGGLKHLVDLVAHSNLYMASQAMQCLLYITDEELYPWHEPAHSDGTDPKTGPDALVWRRMFELSGSPLIPNLLRHQSPDTFPGSGLLALRLVAFLASWLRYHFTPDRVLRLSEGLLGLLKEWSSRPGASDPERTLAKQLHADFSRYPPASLAAAPQLAAEPGATTVAHGGAEDDADDGIWVVQEGSQVSGVPPREADVLREAGNDAYRAGDFSLAIQRYSAALDVPVAAADLLGEGPRRAALLANRSAAYLARAAQGGGQPGAVDGCGLLEGRELGTAEARTQHYQAALMDAQAALDLEPQHVKALYRKAQALYWLGRFEEAATAANDAGAAIRRGPASRSAGLLADVSALADDIRRCVASAAGPGCVPPAGLLAGVRGEAAEARAAGSGRQGDTTLGPELQQMLTLGRSAETHATEQAALPGPTAHQQPLIKVISETPHASDCDRAAGADSADITASAAGPDQDGRAATAPASSKAAPVVGVQTPLPRHVSDVAADYDCDALD